MNSIPIFFASDNNYSPFLCTTMYSILENTSSNVDFYVLDGGIDGESKKLIKKSLENFNNYSVEYIDMSNYNLDRFPNLRHYSINTFSRYFIPEVTPEAGKIIYLDVDIIVKKDIADLYNCDMEKYPLAAVLEDFYGLNAIYLKENVYGEYKNISNYFNAGVLLLDISKFIENNYSQMLVSKTLELKDKLSAPDQDVLNIIFEDNYKVLDYKFNFMPDYFDLLAKRVPDEAENIKKDCYIIHYTKFKPWKTDDTEAFHEFWEIAEKTFFIGKIRNIYERAQYDSIKKVFLFGFIPLPKFKFFAKINKGENRIGLLRRKRINAIKIKYYLWKILLFKIIYFY